MDFPVIERRSRQARRIRIAINALGQVTLTIPFGIKPEVARAFLQTRLDWITAQRAKLGVITAGVQNHQLAWDNRDTLPLRGVPTPVLWVPAQVSGPSVKLKPEGICVYAGKSSPEAQRTRVLMRFLVHEARLEAEHWLAAEGHRLTKNHRVLRITDTRSRWGSCTSQGVISLSWRLILAPLQSFRYVVIHELCHLVHPNHSPQFWALVQQQMPDYLAHETWLKQHGSLLQHYFSGNSARDNAPVSDAAPAPPDTTDQHQGGLF